MIPVYLLVLAGCIPFDALDNLAQVEPNDTGEIQQDTGLSDGEDTGIIPIDDTADTETDTEETDTEDTTVVSNYDFSQNTQYMSSWHLQFQDGLYLSHDGSNGGFGTASYPLLNLGKDWGIAFKWAPDSQITADYILGTETNQSEEVVLFKVGDTFLTLQFVPVAEESTHRVTPQLSYLTMSSGVICRDVAISEPEVNFALEDLYPGFKFYFHFRKGANDDFLTFGLKPFGAAGTSASNYMILDNRNVTPMYEKTISNFQPIDCISQNLSVGFGQRDTIFWSAEGMASQDPSQMRVMGSLEGMVDDLMILKTMNEQFLQPHVELFATDTWGDVIAGPSGHSESNMFWFNFDSDGQNDNLVAEATPVTGSTQQYFTMSTITQSYQYDELTHSEAGQYYHQN